MMTLSIWIWYAVGQIIHVGLQIQAVAQAKNNPAKTFVAAFKQRWPQVLARVFVATALFLAVHSSPDFILRILSALGLNFNPGAGGLIINTGTAGLAGYFADSLLGFIPGLKGTVPPIVPDPPSGN